MIASQGIIYEMPRVQVTQTRAARFKNHRRFAKYAQAFRELQERERKKN